jgi:Fur family peroxide stress response transcriptional regulator
MEHTRIRQRAPRVTKQRKAIFSVLQGDNSHPTAEEIYQRVKQRLPHISLATVYRNLRMLTQEGLILEISTPDGPNRYDPQTHQHYHFLCDQCGRVYDVEIPVQRQLNQELSRQGYRVRSHETVFYGLCQNCHSASF